jgi:hypothetical protein
MFTNCNMPLVSSLKTHFFWTRGFLVCQNHGVKFFVLILQEKFQYSSYAEAFLLLAGITGMQLVKCMHYPGH